MSRSVSGQSLNPIERGSLVDVVGEQIRQSIEGGGYRSGDRLPSEPELTAQLGVSRTVLREAIKRLQTDGLVTIRRGIGTYVADRSDLTNCLRLVRTAMALSPRELLQYVELREAVEVHAVRRAALEATDREITEVEALCGEMEDEAQDWDVAMQLDLQFHLRLVDIGKNALMRGILEILHEHILEGMRRTTPQPRQCTMSRRVHMGIVEAVRNRDPDAAEAAIRDHMNILVRRLQELPETGPR